MPAFWRIKMLMDIEMMEVFQNKSKIILISQKVLIDLN